MSSAREICQRVAGDNNVVTFVPTLECNVLWYLNHILVREIDTILKTAADYADSREAWDVEYDDVIEAVKLMNIKVYNLGQPENHNDLEGILELMGRTVSTEDNCKHVLFAYANNRDALQGAKDRKIKLWSCFEQNKVLYESLTRQKCHDHVVRTYPCC